MIFAITEYCVALKAGDVEIHALTFKDVHDIFFWEKSKQQKAYVNDQMVILKKNYMFVHT